MSKTPIISPEQARTFLATLSSHDARHNLCQLCITRARRVVTVIQVNGKWLHNQKGYTADHEAEPGGKLTAGSREIWPWEEIIVDPFMAPREPTVDQKRAIMDYLKGPRRHAHPSLSNNP